MMIAPKKDLTNTEEFLSYIIYSSKPTRKLEEQGLLDLLVTARKENAERNITGMLLCFKDMYIQLLEGPEVAIQQLYQNLLKDSRHVNVTAIKRGFIQKRFFPNWSMGIDNKGSLTNYEDASFDIFDTQSSKLLDILDVL
jgi:hypothetical protein